MRPELNPLIPLDDLKQVVKELIAVPKSEIKQAEAKGPKRKRKEAPRSEKT